MGTVGLRTILEKRLRTNSHRVGPVSDAAQWWLNRVVSPSRECFYTELRLTALARLHPILHHCYHGNWRCPYL